MAVEMFIFLLRSLFTFKIGGIDLTSVRHRLVQTILKRKKRAFVTVSLKLSEFGSHFRAQQLLFWGYIFYYDKCYFGSPKFFIIYNIT